MLSGVIPPLSLLILLGSSPFFLMNLVKGLSVLCIYSKNQLLISLIISIVVVDSISFIFALIFIISFLPVTLGFVSPSLLISFRCKFRLFEIFHSSLGRPVLL